MRATSASLGVQVGYCTNPDVHAANPTVSLYEFTGDERYRRAAPVTTVTWGSECLLHRGGQMTFGADS